MRRALACLAIAAAMIVGVGVGVGVGVDVVDSAHADRDPLAPLLRRIDAVAREVSRVRGLPIKKPIAHDIVGRDELRARLLKLASDDKTAAETAAEGLALERWGMLPPGTRYDQLVVELLTEQIAGYYDSETKKLTISRSAGKDLAWAEMVLAHELDHALQDQSFDLHAFEDVAQSEGDAAIARRALVEGDGIGLMIEVMLARNKAKVDWANPEIASAIEKAMMAPGAPGNDKIDQAPLVVRESMLFPYRAGFGFVAALRRRQPWRAVDAAYARPPRSTEQILHPERYIADDAPIVVAVPTPAALPGYAQVHATVWGELGFSLWLRSLGVDARIANDAAAGWGGDRAVVLAKPGDRTSSPSPASRAVAISRSEWDSEIDAIEAAEAASKALAALVVGGTVERSSTRTRILALDGTVSWLDRRGATLVIVVGAPAWSADALARELWPATPTPPASPTPPPPTYTVPASSPPAPNLRGSAASR